MQDIDTRLEQEIEAPQLLAGIDITEKRAARRLFKPEEDTLLNDKEDLFKANEKLKNQSLFREREVENLHKLIYNSPPSPNHNEELAVDSNRFDTNPIKL